MYPLDPVKSIATTKLISQPPRIYSKNEACCCNSNLRHVIVHQKGQTYLNKLIVPILRPGLVAFFNSKEAPLCLAFKSSMDVYTRSSV